MLQAPEAILDRSISGLEAWARENWHWFTQSSPRTLCPGFPLFHLGAFDCEKEDSFQLPPKQQCIIKATVNCNSIWKAVRTYDCFRYQCLLFSLSLVLSLVLSSYLFSSPSSLLANFLSLFIFSAQVEFWFISGLSFISQSAFSSSAPMTSQFPALQFSISQSHLTGQMHLFIPGHTGHKSLAMFWTHHSQVTQPTCVPIN